MSILASIIRNRFGLTSYPGFITFFVTWRCNCKCIMCDIWKKEKQHELTTDEIGAIFKQLKPIDAIRISGGEPFMRADLGRIINIIEERVRPKIIHITTNGLLTEAVIGILSKIKPVRKVHLKVSIDDIEDAHDRIRGHAGAYRKALATIEQAAQLRRQLGFYLGVDQTIVDEGGLASYTGLKSILSEYNVNVHPVIAYDTLTALYSNAHASVLPERSYTPYGKFSKQRLGEFIVRCMKDASSLDSIEERLLKKYYLRGLYNRLIRDEKRPQPPCVALKSHLRILPNGDVPICMYNATVVGNLREKDFKDIWFSPQMLRHRHWVSLCKGCWAGCESNVNAAYSGDIWRSLF